MTIRKTAASGVVTGVEQQGMAHEASVGGKDGEWTDADARELAAENTAADGADD